MLQSGKGEAKTSCLVQQQRRLNRAHHTSGWFPSVNIYRKPFIRTQRASRSLCCPTRRQPSGAMWAPVFCQRTHAWERWEYNQQPFNYRLTALPLHHSYLQCNVSSELVQICSAPYSPSVSRRPSGVFQEETPE